MAKKTETQADEAQPLAERAEYQTAQSAPLTTWQRVAQAWASKDNTRVLAERLERELARAGIHSVDELVRAPVNAVAAAARAAMQADAQSLIGAAAQIKEGDA